LPAKSCGNLDLRSVVYCLCTLFHEETYLFTLKSFQYVFLSVRLFFSFWGKDHWKQISTPIAEFVR